jgi:tetratricopeptide (TPR) repeat protein
MSGNCTGNSVFARSVGVIVLVLSVAIAPHANADDDLIGQKVFLKGSARPRVGNKTLVSTDIAIPAIVSKVDGDWAWVGKAWVKRNELVTIDEAPAYYTRALNSNPNSGDAYLCRGLAWMLKREYTNAVKDYTLAIRYSTNPSNLFAVYDARGAAYHALHEHKKALADITEAIRLNPAIAMLFNDRGCIYTSLDEHQKADADFIEALRLDPKLALAWSNRATNWTKLKKYDRALEDFDKALKLDPKSWHAHVGRGYVWSKQGRYGRALEDWDETIQLAPDLPWGYMNKARIWSTCGSLSERDGKKALEAAKQACELAHWDEWRCVSVLACAYAECGKFDEAIKHQKKAIEMDRNPEEADKKKCAKQLADFEAHRAYTDPDVTAEMDEEDGDTPPTPGADSDEFDAPKPVTAEKTP